MKYSLHYHPSMGHLIGVIDDQGRCIPMDEGNHDWREFLEWNAAQPEPLDLKPKEPKGDK